MLLLIISYIICSEFKDTIWYKNRYIFIYNENMCIIHIIYLSILYALFSLFYKYVPIFFLGNTSSDLAWIWIWIWDRHSPGENYVLALSTPTPNALCLYSDASTSTSSGTSPSSGLSLSTSTSTSISAPSTHVCMLGQIVMPLVVDTRCLQAPSAF